MSRVADGAQMNSFIENFGGPVFSNVLALVLWTLGVIIAVWIAFRFYDKKRPKCCYLTDQKIAAKRDAPSDIAIQYRGETVSGVSSTLVWIWNGGRKPITREDLRDGGVLKVKLVGGGDALRILDVEVWKVSRTAIQFRAEEKGPECAEVSFNFLDAGDGAVIEILHTGNRRTAAEIEGTILEAPKGVVNLGALDETSAISGSGGANLSRPRRTLLKKILWSVPVVVFWLVLLAGVNVVHKRVSTTPELLRGNLKEFVKPGDLDRAVIAVTENQAWGERMPNWVYESGRAILSVFFFALPMGAIWSAPYAFPESLRLEDRRNKLKGGNGSEVDKTAGG